MQAPAFLPPACACHKRLLHGRHQRSRRTHAPRRSIHALALTRPGAWSSSCCRSAASSACAASAYTAGPGFRQPLATFQTAVPAACSQSSIPNPASSRFFLPLIRKFRCCSSNNSNNARKASLLVACASPSSPSGSQWVPNPMELVQREAGLQSNRLDSNLRERVEMAVEQLGGRVTVGDVAARAGVKLADADEALKALAYDTQASLKVSSEGALVYGFVPDFRSQLRSRSLLIAATPLLRRTVGVLSYLSRIAFGTALLASVALVWLAIAVLLSSRSDDRDNRRRGGGGGVTFFIDPVDLFMYWDPYYERKRAARSAELGTGGMNFVEAVFSFVFGDGDPNESYDERRWQELGSMIRKKGGIVTAEEMAPFLEPPAPAPLPPAYTREPYVPYPDESFVLPALIKFGGEAEVDEQGRILYCFPALQRTGVQQQRWRLRSRTESTPWNVPLEQTRELTAATPGQIAGVLTLGLFNLVGVGLLSGLLADPRGPALLAMQGLGFVVPLMGPLKLYAGAFFAIPTVRWVLNQIRNREIESRNEAREGAIDVLVEAESAASSAPAAAVGDKVAAARRKALAEGRFGPQLVRDEEILFDSGQDAGRQLNALERDDWDQRLAQRQQERERERGGQGRW